MCLIPKDLIWTNYTNVSHPSYLKVKKVEALKKILCIAIATLGIGLVTAALVYNLAPKSLITNISLGSISALGFSLISVFALYSYIKWRKLKSEMPLIATSTLFGFDGFRKQERVRSEKKDAALHEAKKGEGSLSSLADDSILEIVSSLDTRTILNLEQTSKRMKRLVYRYCENYIKENYGDEGLNYKETFRLIAGWKEGFFTIYKKTLPNGFREPHDFIIIDNKLHLTNGNECVDGEGNSVAASRDRYGLTTFSPLKHCLLAGRERWVEAYNFEKQYLFTLTFPTANQTSKLPPSILGAQFNWMMYALQQSFDLSYIHEWSNYLIHVRDNAFFAFDRMSGKYVDHLNLSSLPISYHVSEKKVYFTCANGKIEVIDEGLKSIEFFSPFSNLRIHGTVVLDQKTKLIFTEAGVSTRILAYEEDFSSYEFLNTRKAEVDSISFFKDNLAIIRKGKFEIFDLAKDQTLYEISIYPNEWSISHHLLYKNFMIFWDHQEIRVVDMDTGNLNIVHDFRDDKEWGHIQSIDVLDGKLIALVSHPHRTEDWKELVVFDFGKFV